MRTIWIDIDGPLAWKNEARLVEIYGQYLPLEVSAERLEKITSVAAFERLPEVLTWKERVGDVTYHYLLQLLVYVPEHLEEASVIEDAWAGIQTLLTVSDQLGYCTARRGNTDMWNRGVQRATLQWLTRHRFPHAENTVFCADPRAKLQYIADQLALQPGPVVLIDDLYATLVSSFSTLTAREQHLLSTHLVIGAYGALTVGDAPFGLLPLPTWKECESFLTQLEWHFNRLSKEVPYG